MASHQFAFHKGLYCCSPFDFADATLRANGATGEVVPHPFVLESFDRLRTGSVEV